MEEVEANLLEGGIGWLAETIVENLDTVKLDAWIRQVGLADDTKKLRSEIERVEVVVADVKGRAIANKPLFRSLGRLRDVLYDADDVVDDLDYYRLQHQVQGDARQDTPESAGGHGAQQTEIPRGNAGEPSGSGVKRRSEKWQYFDIIKEQNGKPTEAKCVDCGTVVKCGSHNGTSVLNNHRNSGKCKKKRGATDQRPNLPSDSEGAANGNSIGRKRMRTEGPSTDHVAVNMHSWNKAELSSRIQQMTNKLQEAMSEVVQLRGSDYFLSLNLHQNTSSDSCLRTSSLLQRKIYGRVQEKEYIIKQITEAKSDGVTVLPIVGIGGIGKTALAQLIYNDPLVVNSFQQRIWLWVSNNNFDDVQLTREMLDFVCQESHERLCSFAKLQEMLMGYMKSKRFLLILDDVWEDNMNNGRLDKLLPPLKFNGAKGNVILVTTRILSVAKRICTVEPVKLNALETKDSWLLLKQCVFGDENHEPCVSLSTIGHKLIDKFKGNPLAGENVGELLREYQTVEHWNNILNTEDWKSLQLSGGIMPSLKRSYDHLPSHLQQCFSYCSLFPKGYSFSKEQLVQIWIAQGFVKNSSEKLEQAGLEYLDELVNSGFFQQVKSMFSSSEEFVAHDLMHDLARMVSRTEYATIDGSDGKELAPTVRHLSITTHSAYRKDQFGNISRNEEFEESLLKFLSRRKLRSLILIGQYDSHFCKTFQDVFKEAHHLRLLQMISSYANYDSFLSSLTNSTHLRYLRVENKESCGDLPQALSKCHHLQVLDISSCGTSHEYVNDLVLQQPSQISIDAGQPGEPIDILTSPTRLASSLTCLQTLHLENCGKWQRLPLERLGLLRNLVLIKLGNATEISIPSLEELVLIELPRLKTCTCTSVRDLNSSLRFLNIKGCSMMEVFPLFEDCLQFEIERTSCMPRLSKVTIHDCPRLHMHNPIPLSTTVSELSISRVSTLPTMEGSLRKKLKIGIDVDEECIDDDYIDEDSNQLIALDDKVLSFHNLRFLTNLKISGCKNLTTISFEGLRQLICLKNLTIYNCPKLLSSIDSSELTSEDMAGANRSNLPSLESLDIANCGITGKWLSLMLQHVQSLRELSLTCCEQITGLSKAEEENSRSNLMLAVDAQTLGRPSRDKILHLPLNLIPSLKKVIWISDFTLHGMREGFARLTSLEKLYIEGDCYLDSDLAYIDGNDEQAKGRWSLPLSLRELTITTVYTLKTLQLCFPQSLEETYVDHSLETLKPCFPSHLTCLKKLEVSSTSLKSLELQSCTALEELKIIYCKSLATIEGLQSLGNIKYLEVHRCPYLQCHELYPRLERLQIDDPSILTRSFCKHLTSLQRLELSWFEREETRLTDEQERALQLLTSLQELRFESCSNLIDLPTVLHSLPSLKRLEIYNCWGIARLPEMGLPPSLEELDIHWCSEDLADQCITLASKLKVKINGNYVN